MSRMKDIIKVNSPAMTAIAGHSILSGVSMGTLTVRLTDAQGLIHDMVLPAMNVLGLGRHMILRETAALKWVNTITVKQSYFDVVHFKVPLRIKPYCPTIFYPNLDLTPRCNHQTEATFPTRVILGHSLPTGSALATRWLWPLAGSGEGQQVRLPPSQHQRSRSSSQLRRRRPGLPALQKTASALDVRLINVDALWAASNFTPPTSFAAATATPGLSTTTATPAMPATAMAEAGANIWRNHLEHPNEGTM